MYLYSAVSRNVMGFWRNLLHVVVSRIWSIFQNNIQQKRSFFYLLNWLYIITFCTVRCFIPIYSLLIFYLTKATTLQESVQSFPLVIGVFWMFTSLPFLILTWLVGNQRLPCESMDTFAHVLVYKENFFVRHQLNLNWKIRY